MNLLSSTMNMLKYYHKFGSDGIKVLRNAHTKKHTILELSIPQAKHKIYLRGGTSDIRVFDEVFFTEDYYFNYAVKPRIIVDCGANVGLTAVYLSNFFPEARIISIEPDFENFALLQKNTEAYNNVECLQKGVWNKEALLEITNRSTNISSGFTVEEVAQRSNESIEAITIPAILKRYSIDTIDVLKIDIEGAEKELFSLGTECWLPRVKHLVIETHDNVKRGTTKSVFTALSNYDYSMLIRGQNLFIRFNH
jgi:FkbM family methyltransferase